MPATHSAAIVRPVATDPVNEMASTCGCLMSASPTTDPRPITRLKTPGGIPDAAMIFDSACAVPGTRSAGLNTTQLPYASAGAIFHAGMAIGKFHGVMIPTTPSGSRVTSTSMPGRTEAIFSPARRRHSPAKNRKICPARAVSPTASGIVLPSSRDSSRPSSSLRARISSPMRFRMSWRCWMPLIDHAGNAARAASTARAAALASARANRPTISAVLDGLTSSAASLGASHSPAMKLPAASMCVSFRVSANDR